MSATKYEYIMRNYATGERVVKEQKTEPRMRGFVCVQRQRVLPERDSDGCQLFYDANNEPYYARVMADGSHYRP